MIALLKDLLHALLAPSLYAGIWISFLASAFKRAEWALYLLAIVAPLPVIWYQIHPFPFGKDTMDILIAGVFLGVMFNKGGFERAPGTLVIGAFMLVSFLALLNATARFNLPLPLTTANPLLGDWKNFVEMIFLYFLAYNALKEEKEHKVILVIMAIVILFIAVREFRNFSESSGGFSYDRRAAGPFWIVGLGANHFGAFVAHYGGGLLFGMSLIDKHRYRRWLYLAAALFCLHPLFFSYSRGAYLATLVILVVYGLVKKRSLLIGAVVLLLTWQLVLPESVVERITMTEDASGQIEESAAHRLILWNHAVQLFHDNPFFGVGFNGFGFTVPERELTDTHNYYLKIASEQGVIGLLVLGAILLRAIGSGWRLYRSGLSDFHRALGFGFFGCSIALAVTNIFGDRFSYFILGSYFWILWGVVDRAIVLAQKTTATAPVKEPPLETAPASAAD